MNRAQIKQLNKKIDKILKIKKLPNWPILGGLSDSSITRELTRSVTPEEGVIARAKGLPCPISIALSRETEFLEYLNAEYN